MVDIDGVVADVRHRLHHVRRRPKDWDAFFAAAPADPLLEEGARLVHRLAGDHEVVWLTGRPVSCRQDTLRWLQQVGLPEGRLFMRRRGDFRPARVTKLERLRELAAQRPVAVLVDDDEQVVAAARAAGFPVHVADWMDRPESVDSTLLQAQEQEGRS